VPPFDILQSRSPAAAPTKETKMRLFTMAIAALSLGGAALAGTGALAAGPGNPALIRAASSLNAGADNGLVMQVQNHPHTHHRHYGYHHPRYYPGYGPRHYSGYGYTPYSDWTTRCMEDLGYGRRGMYGCGGR
jgi:hypothetical protein